MSGARHFQQLTVWLLADELRSEVLTLTARREFLRDLKLRTQTEDAIESACRNIAEGFGCDTHREFARFLEISRRSLNEVQDCFLAAQTQRFVNAMDLRPARLLLVRLFPAMSRFIAYLDSTPDWSPRWGRSGRPAPLKQSPSRPPRNQPKRPAAKNEQPLRPKRPGKDDS